MTFVCAVNYHFVPVSDLLHNHSVDDRSGVNDSEQADNCKASSKDRGASRGFCFDFPRLTPTRAALCDCVYHMFICPAPPTNKLPSRRTNIKTSAPPKAHRK